MAEKEDNQNLVRLLQKGNVAAFDSLFEVYSSRLYTFALKYLKSESDAEELVQEVFIKVWENRKSLKTELSFKAYLFKISLNLIRRHFNKKAITLHYFESLQHDRPINNDPLLNNEDYETVIQRINLIIEEMPPRRREIFIKSKMDGKSSKQIAAELGISSGTVDNHISEAIQQLRSRLKSENIIHLLFAVLFIF
ncbi:MAG: RNA polymerase sigma factor [Candidatus Saccharibacteria bacterium]